MKTALLSAAIVIIAVLASAASAQDRTVLVVEGDKLPRVKVGDVIRITQSAAVGRTEISAAVEGPAKLVSTTNVRRVRDGKPLIGATTKEFEIQAEKKGKATITITIKDLVDKKDSVKKYELEIE